MSCSIHVNNHLITWSLTLRIRSKETRVIKSLKKIFSNQKTIELINALTRANKLGYYSYIGREIEYDPYKLSKIINRNNFV